MQSSTGTQPAQLPVYTKRHGESGQVDSLMPTNVTTNGQLVRYYREQLGWTQLQLAMHSGLSERVVRKAEAGGSVRAETLEILAEALSSPRLSLHPADLSAEPVAVCQAFVRGYLEHGVESARRCAHLFAPDIVLKIHTDAENLAFGGEFHGVDGIDRMLRDALRQFTSVSEDFGRWTSDGQRVMALRRQVLRAADSSDLLETWIVHEYVVEKGLIARIDTYIDSLAYSRYLEFAERAG